MKMSEKLRQGAEGRAWAQTRQLFVAALLFIGTYAHAQSAGTDPGSSLDAVLPEFQEAALNEVVPPSQPDSTSVPAYAEYDKKVQAAEQTAPLTSQLFGDTVSPYLGQTEFDVVDIDLPGNSVLPVQLRRRFVVAALTDTGVRDPNGGIGNPYGGIGNWDVEVPYISGVFDFQYRWDTPVGSSTRVDRCSSPFNPRTQAGFSSAEVWSGEKVHIPGSGDRALMQLDAVSWPPAHAQADATTHKWTTSSFDSFTCTNTTNGDNGQGFVMTTTEGVTYTFDIYLQRQYPAVSHASGPGGSNGRVMIFLLASQVTDRYGNWVKYGYDSAGHPHTISSNDGRLITLNYDPADASKLLTAVVSLSAPVQTRTWTYDYLNSTRDTYPQLATVTLPDNTQWKYTYSNDTNYLYVTYSPPDPSGMECLSPAISTPGGNFTLGITHPSGSQGTFQFQLRRQHRDLPSFPPNCQLGHYSVTPYVDAFSLTSKTISDSAASPSTWAYSYRVSACSGSTCASTTNRVSQPDGSYIDSTYSTEFGATGPYVPAGSAIEGQLLGTVIYGFDGTALRSQVNQYIAGPDVDHQPFTGQPFPSRYGLTRGGDDASSGSLRPLQSVTTTQDGATFTRSNLAFDAYARPTQVKMFSTLGVPNSRTETTTYTSDESQWILGLVDTKTDTTVSATPVTELQNGYDAKLNLTSVTEFGVLTRSMTYNNTVNGTQPADGTLHSINDGLHTTTLGTFTRGIPTSVDYEDGTSRSATIDDVGEIRKVTDENGFYTSYDYNPVGRLTSITYPPNDSVQWNPTTIAYERIATDEVGISGLHWRQTTSTGNATDGYAKHIAYYDLRWRPVATTEYDSADQANTQRYTKRSYDFADRETFTSYPSASSSPSMGTKTQYDALGRVVQTTQDSELGASTVVTKIAYLAPFTKQVTYPKNQTTDPDNHITTTFQAFDTPSEDAPLTISAPQGVSTAFVRDVFGKPSSVTRSGAYGGGTVSQLRRYVYDSGQRLCKTIEPESGATLQDYDAAGNVAWSTKGSTLTTATCDRASVVMTDKTSYAYDTRNRLTNTAYPSGTSAVSQTYYPDGALHTTTSNGATWTYNYNRRRLLESESLDYDSQGFLIDWTYDKNASLSQLMYPDDMLINFLPNALGQPRQAGPFATSATYWPNGAMKGFTYGNNIVHGLTQNARQLPLRSNDGSVTDLSYTYDANANVSTITDNAQAGLENRTLGYDELNRLISASAPTMWGSATFTYDPLDNLRSSQVGVRNCTHTINNTTNRLTNLSGPSCASTNYGYDVRGNITTRGGQGFTFDRADRMTGATGIGTNGTGQETYDYDGLGRRVGIIKPASKAGANTSYQIYSKDGQLLFGLDGATGNTTDYVYLNGSLVARTEGVESGGAPGSPATPAAPSAIPNPSPDGHYTVSWSQVSGATSYTLTELPSGGQETGVYTGASLSWSPSSPRANGTYMYRVQACAGSGTLCSAFSGTITETVQGGTTAITVTPSTSTDGSFTVSWLPVSGATSYNLFEQVNGGTGTLAYAGSNSSWPTSGRPDGTFIYMVQGCNGSCGNYSAAVTGTVATGIPTQLDASPNPSPNGTYTVTWGAVSSATAYRLEEQVGGTWTEIQNAATTSRTLTGKANGSYNYRARACRSATDVSYCGAYTQTLTEVVQPTPPVIPLRPGSVSVSPLISTDGNYTVTWGLSTAATSYQLQEQYQYGDGAWHDVASPTVTHWSPSPPKTGYGYYLYRVKACNTAGCSAYSVTGSVTVQLPNVLPGTMVMQSIVPSPSTTGLYTVSWGASVRATRYELQEYAGTGWNDVTTNPYTQMSWTTPTARVNGYYDYRARGCNTYGCSAYTSALTEQVQIPAANPMTVPQHFLIKFPNAQVNDLQRLFWDPVTGASNYLVNVRNNSCSSDYQLLIPANDPQPSTITATIPTCNGSNPDLVTLFYSIKACNGSLCSEYSPTITVKVQRTAGLVPDSVATAPTTTYIHTDALHSPVAETNGAGAVTLRTRYEPYGKTLMPPVQGPGYAGHVVDVSTGLSYMQQRYYDPLAGRFLSTDPMATNGGNFNRYAYALNNPYKNIDPDGRCPAGAQTGTCIITDHPANRGQENVKLTSEQEGFANRGSTRDQMKNTRSTTEKVRAADRDNDGKLKLAPLGVERTGAAQKGDSATGTLPDGSEFVAHSHLAESMVDQLPVGDSQIPMENKIPNVTYSASTNKIGVHEVENGKLQFRMLRGTMDSKDQAQIQTNLNSAQDIYNQR
jgi:RHS repeat-associated protein